MLQKIKNNLYSFSAVITLAAVLLVPVGIASAGNTIQTELCKGTNSAAAGQDLDNCGTNGSGRTALTNIARQVVTLFSYIVGIISVIFIIYGGFRYITSGGDSNNVSSAKNTLIYALIGLVIVALAQFIVNFVFSTASGATDAAA